MGGTTQRQLFVDPSCVLISWACGSWPISGACALLSRLAADGTGAAEQLDGEGHEVVMELMTQLEAGRVVG